MSDHLLFAPAAVRECVRELGGGRFLAALSSLVDDEEFDDAGATGAQVAAYLSSRRRAGAEDGAPRRRVHVMVDGDNLIISGLPGPAHEDADDASPPKAPKQTHKKSDHRKPHFAYANSDRYEPAVPPTIPDDDPEDE